MANDVVQVQLAERSYPIIIKPGWLSDLSLASLSSEVAGRCGDIFRGRSTIVVSDETVARLYLPGIQRLISQFKSSIDSIVLPPGEPAKDVRHLERIWNALSEMGHTRQSLLVALGGGVIGDLAGFAAATYMRGIAWVQVPTTLMAQVDSSVGGKTGINLASGKNLVGAFWQPTAVLIDPTVLHTLDDRQYAAGLAEVVKYAVILDDAFFAWLESAHGLLRNREQGSLVQTIHRCCQLKAQVVGDDEREQTGRRAILNYGHTFGHAIENALGYGYALHGEAVSIGMCMAIETARQLGRVSESTVERQRRLLVALGLPTRLTELPNSPPNVDEICGRILYAMGKDKKSDGNRVSLILPSRIGEVESVTWPGDELVFRVLKGCF